MATTVFYNGILLQNVLTREFEQTVVRDPSNTDKWFSRFRITVEAIANANLLTASLTAFGISGSGVAGVVPGHVVQTARQLLAEDRGLFVYSQDGYTILESSTSLDADNGPKVSNLKITHTSQATIKVQFTIECCLVDCQTNGTPNDVISNRWSAADDYGEDFRCTRTWRGVLRMGRAVASPHAFRGLCTPPLQYGWQRSHMSFIGEPNALELGYEITDRQLMGDAPPWPAAKMAISHTEGFALTGAKGFTNFSIHLEGLPGVDRKAMISWGLTIMLAKVFVAGNTLQQYFRQVAVTEHNGDSTSAVEITAQMEKVAVGATNNPLDVIGAAGIGRLGGSLRALALPNYDPALAINLGPFPDGNYTLAGLYAAYLQSPCQSQHGILTGGVTGTPQNDPGDQRGSGNQSGAYYQSGPIPQGLQTITYSQNQQEGMYTHAEITSTYHIDDGRFFLPIASAGGRFAAGKDTLAAIRLWPRTATRSIHVEYERIGKPPALWKLDDFVDVNEITHYFDECVPNFQPPKVLGDGSILHVVDATYTFALSRAPTDAESYRTSALPWDTSQSDDNGYDQSNLVDARDTKGIG